MSSDNLDPSSLHREVQKRQLDNFIKQEEGVTADENTTNPPCIDIVENIREDDEVILVDPSCKEDKGEAPFEESNLNSSRHRLTETDK